MSSDRQGPLQHNASLSLGIGGAESNVAIALERLGTSATWIGKVGKDPFGDLVLREIRAEGVEVVGIRDRHAPTAIMVKERRSADQTRVWYYRAEAAGSRLTVDDVDFDLIGAASALHVTGISLALSPSMAEVTAEAIRVARHAGVVVSFDLNFRSRLWSREEAAEAYRRIIPQVDVVFGGVDEAAIALGGGGTPMAMANGLSELGPREAVIKLGADGAVAVADGKEYRRAAVSIEAVDTVGAGDAFAAGYLSDSLRGETIDQRLTTAVQVGAYACLVSGDWEGLPRRDELEALTAVEPVLR